MLKKMILVDFCSSYSTTNKEKCAKIGCYGLLKKMHHSINNYFLSNSNSFRKCFGNYLTLSYSASKIISYYWYQLLHLVARIPFMLIM